MRARTAAALFVWLPLAAGGLFAGAGSCKCNAPPQVDEQCQVCHGTADRGGIEDAHPGKDLLCSECHGGDPEATTKEAAHITKPEGIDNPRQLATDMLDELPEEYLRFINPGDLRVATIGCGSGNPAAEGGGCHQDQVETVSRSVMSTFVGHYNVPRFLAGLQDREAEFGARDIVHAEYDPATAPPGAVESLTALRPPPDTADPASLQRLMDHYLVKACPTCHAYSFGPNNDPGNYRSSGCTSCHMVYDNNGLSKSGDPTIDKQGPSHPIVHELTTAIPESQCEHCHFQGARIGLMFQGIREGGFDDVPPNAVPLGERRHAHPPDFYFTDEDSTQPGDETPGDLHWQAGMTCVDCHVGGDVHGDGNMYSTAKFQVGIRCEDCHGTVREPIVESDDGFFYSDSGSRLKQLRRNSAGVIELVGAMDEEIHLVTQIKERLDTGINQNMVRAMAPDPVTGVSHTDSMECYACHTEQRQSCFGCHVEVDDRLSAFDHQTGTSTKGSVQGGRDWYDLDIYLLGTNGRGKITSVCPSQQLFMSYINEDGVKVIDEQVRTTASGKLGFGWQPNNQHVVTRKPQNCDRCHPKPDESNMAEVRTTYGFGNGQYMMADGDGVMYDLTKILDEDGTPLVDFAHEGTGAVSIESIARAMAVHVEPLAD